MKHLVSLPFTGTAFRLLSAEAQTEGVPVNTHAANLLAKGFGLPAGRVLEDVLGDARHEAQFKVQHRAG